MPCGLGVLVFWDSAAFHVWASGVRWRLHLQGGRNAGVVNDRRRLVRGGLAAEPAAGSSTNPLFQESCLQAFKASQVTRGFARTTMDNGAETLDRSLATCGCPARTWTG